MKVRAALSGVVAVGLALMLTPLGCGGAHVEHRSHVETSAVAEAPAIPDEIVDKLKGCIRQHAGDLTT